MSGVPNSDGGNDRNASAPVKGKRSLERDDDDDEDMDGMDEDDLERFGGRHFAPFVDQPL
jgi:hypothetical protein